MEDAVAKAVAEVAARAQALAGPLAITAPPPVHTAPTPLTALPAPAAPATPAEEAGAEVSDGAKFAAFAGAKKKSAQSGPESKRAAATDKRRVPTQMGLRVSRWCFPGLVHALLPPKRGVHGRYSMLMLMLLPCSCIAAVMRHVRAGAVASCCCRAAVAAKRAGHGCRGCCLTPHVARAARGKQPRRDPLLAWRWRSADA